MKTVPVARGLIGAALLASAQPALADGGVITSYVARKGAEFVLNFLSAASSNASAAVQVTATSGAGAVTVPDQDTGFFSATASATASSGNLARKKVTILADYNFFEPNEIVLTPEPSVFIVPNGISTEWYANAKIKGILQVLVEAIPSPFRQFALAAPVSGELLVPISFNFDLSRHSSYRFDVGLEYEDGSLMTLAEGTAGAGGASILFPYLEASNPALAAALRNQYLGQVDGKIGNVAFTLGEGLVPPGADGVTGLPVTVDLGRSFRLNTGFGGDGAEAVPEPASWAMMIAGFGLVGAAMRRRRGVAVQAR